MVYHLNVLVCVSYSFATCKIHTNINHKQNDPKWSKKKMFIIVK